jgi:heat-inducible transcriptional repressor
LLNHHLSGLSVLEINRSLIEEMLGGFGRNAYILMPVLGIIADMIVSEDDVRVYASGVKNILAYPEFADVRKAEAIVQALEDREFLFTIVGPSGTRLEGIEIHIGCENQAPLLQSCSLVKANYTIDNQNAGVIAIIGPMRMDYALAASVLAGILVNIKHVARALGLAD